MYNSMLITTTNSIEDTEIIEYLGIVKAHCTAGIGFFGDFAAGLTDFFGGRSGTYEKQMQLIDNEVLSGLIENAQNLNADAIIGLRLDNDQISGKGTQMLMVTAYGTAVKLKGSTSTNRNYKVITRRVMEIIELKNNIIERSTKIPFDYQPQDWDFIIKERIQEIEEKVIDNIRYWKDSTFEVGREKLEFCKKYFLQLGDSCKNTLYTTLEKQPDLFIPITEIIKEGHFCDYNLINHLILNSNFENQKLCLELIKFDKNEYTNKDSEEIRILIQTIESIFKNRSTTIEERARLSGNIQKRWQCECGNKNSMDIVYCSKCGKDQFGFEQLKLNKNKSIALLKAKLNIIENMINE